MEINTEFFVRCSRCGEVLKTYATLSNDLSILYGEEGQADLYFTRMTITDS